MMDIEINTKGKELFLALATLSLFLLMIITTLLWWFISPRLHEISEFLADISLTALRVFYLILVIGTILIYLTCFLERNFLVARFAVKLFIVVIFPVTILLGKIFGISKDKIRESYVYVNNAFIKALKKKFDPSEVLILLPHCLQNTECGIRITVDIFKCVRCGKCDIGDLTKLAVEHGIPIAIATGGTLARRIIVEHRPKFIIAVACERDLVDGLHDVFPIPVYGVLNERPEGPCINTRVMVEKIRLALKIILK
ncbi:MAG: hypothetical protein B6D62_00750 [Candidatus Cloacimonas sp. 4484_275]|nr:MAG: hypothetical protein B6D62_00750 [Candidatus Cloacimonas sp. 4484_275]